MKKLFTLALAAVAVATVGCSAPTKTIENLKAAATGEINASTKYAEFSKRAAADSMFRVAAMLEATSKAEAIHAANHVAELKKLGVEFTPVADAVTVDSTLSNLYVAKNGEEYEVQSMYPEFIAVSQTESANGAIQVFDWAMKAEVKHAAYYIEAIEALQNNGSDEIIIGEWIVCPKCGDTYKKGEAPETCELCGTASGEFLAFAAQAPVVAAVATATAGV